MLEYRIIKVNVNMWVISQEDMDSLSINFIIIIVDLLTCGRLACQAYLWRRWSMCGSWTDHNYTRLWYWFLYAGHNFRLRYYSTAKTFTIMIRTDVQPQGSYYSGTYHSSLVGWRWTICLDEPYAWMKHRCCLCILMAIKVETNTCWPPSYHHELEWNPQRHERKMVATMIKWSSSLNRTWM